MVINEQVLNGIKSSINWYNFVNYELLLHYY